MSNPPPLPATVLARVLRIAAIDGGVLVFLAGGFALISISMADWLGATVGGLAAAAGVVELQGRRRLKAGDFSGVSWLVRSEILLLAVILLYVTYQYFRYDPRPFLEMVDREYMVAQRTNGLTPSPLAENFGLTSAQLIALARSSAKATYALVGILSIGFQGGLAYYYHRKGPIIARALRKS